MITNLVRVVTQEVAAGDLPTGNVARVLNEDGSGIRGVTAVEARIAPNDIIRLTIQLIGHVDITGVPTFVMNDPASGELRAVRSITWADGETVEFPS